VKVRTASGLSQAVISPYTAKNIAPSECGGTEVKTNRKKLRKDRNLKNILRGCGSYGVRSGVILLLSLMFVMLGFAAAAIPDSAVFWQGFAGLLIFILSCAILFPCAMIIGTADFKRLMRNLSRNSAPRGFDVRAKEYAVRKGFVIGGIYAALIVLLTVVSAAGVDFTRYVLLLLQLPFVEFLRSVRISFADGASSYLWLFLITAALPALVYGAGYIFGGERERGRHEAFLRHKRGIEEGR
jgi:hypothetical protein